MTKKQSHLDSTELEELESTLASVRSHPDKDNKETKSIADLDASLNKSMTSSTDCRNEQSCSEDHDELGEGNDLRSEEIFMFEAEDSDITDGQQSK